MTITRVYQQGAIESFAETIRYLLYTQWNPANTTDDAGTSITPDVFSPRGMNGDDASLTTALEDIVAWPTDQIDDAIYVNQRETLLIKDDVALGFQNFRLQTAVSIDIFTLSSAKMFLFQEEVNRIIAENQPNTSARIKKSNNTQNSAIASFGEIQLDFLKPILLDKTEFWGNDHAVGILHLNWEKIKT